MTTSFLKVHNLLEAADGDALPKPKEEEKMMMMAVMMDDDADDQNVCSKGKKKRMIPYSSRAKNTRKRPKLD